MPPTMFVSFVRKSINSCIRSRHAVDNRYRFNNYCTSILRQVPTNETDGETTQHEWPRRVVSGLQPTGALHIGNYFGAVRRCVRLQEQGDDLTIFIADLHSLTTHQDPSLLQENILELTACLLASGIDPERSILFTQSSVARHSELCWLLTCLATHARLAHLPQYKEKSAKMKEIPLGLLLYPVLQAADVLIYRGTHVPVGIDQLQHLQVASQLVRTFHHRYGKVFPTPKPLLAVNDALGQLLGSQCLSQKACAAIHNAVLVPSERGLQTYSLLALFSLPTPQGIWRDEDGSDRLRSLRDPSKKMSKSDTDSKSRILLTDPDDIIHMKIKKAVTDFTPRITYDPENRPGVSNLVAIHCLAQDKLPEEIVEEVEGLNTVQYKRLVAEALSRTLTPVRERAAELRARPTFLRDVLRHGAARARVRADEVYEKVTELVGTAPIPVTRRVHAHS